MSSSAGAVGIAGVLIFMTVMSDTTYLNCVRDTDESKTIDILIETGGEDFTCKYLGRISNKTYVIGECIFSIRQCFVSKEPVLAGLLKFNYTLTGGVLTIRNLTEYVYGTYYCYETYNQHINASLEIPDECIKQNTASTHVNNEPPNSLIVVLCSVGSSILILVMCICVYCAYTKRQNEGKRVPAKTMLTYDDIERKNPKHQSRATARLGSGQHHLSESLTASSKGSTETQDV